MRPDDRPLTVWIVVQRPDDLVSWVEANRLVHAEPHLELVIDIMVLGRRRAVVERRLTGRTVLICAPVDHLAPWRPHGC